MKFKIKNTTFVVIFIMLVLSLEPKSEYYPQYPHLSISTPSRHDIIRENYQKVN